jgi:hypothetical protein
MNRVLAHSLWALALSPCLAAPAAAQQPSREVYRCPGNPVLYTDTLSAKEARDKGCRTLEGAPITVVQAVRPRPSTSGGASTPVARPADQRVDPNDQRARDNDARRILEGELRREEERLAEMQREFNGGEPERHGAEMKNPQRYNDRIAEMRASIQRKEGDIAAIKRELSKLPQ